MGTPDSLGRRHAPGSARRALVAVTGVLGALVVVQPMVPVVAHALDPSMASVTGIVFNDRNGNGSRDSGERGVEGVSVSDGARTVRTDGSGRYAFEVDVDRRLSDIVFVTKPAGFAVATDEFKTPRFYRSFGQLVDGAQVRADFALRPDPRSNSGNFTFANVADTHVNVDLADQFREISATTQDLAFAQVIPEGTGPVKPVRRVWF